MPFGNPDPGTRIRSSTTQKYIRCAKIYCAKVQKLATLPNAVEKEIIGFLSLVRSKKEMGQRANGCCVHSGLPDFYWSEHTKTKKMYQMTTNYTKKAINFTKWP
jgi:hypothetical protein